ncbi:MULTISPECIES: 4'-phosphopantetheinyl transferase family protein [Pseudonocardia]|uniref:Holo-(Acyl carrier protein) synthase 2 n=2 Tax=Pseudonocardia TaxID=1847 RepID=A0A1Y2N6L3_PSEAH|nr:MULTISPECIES: 4'-phosphopantetheinyl transferase superfamily protein [Pseudonocardia]OSY42809.1 holo-(acyl carrier protein) synthase 2 [Pseudonocardia autotrophica]TDN77386.1 4'-phosphopantetheinyl transferase superfamily protein [Pseudonocardia autotrophica]BBG01409.1 hypothetical protein Pdca_26180 [Pseudonocardia autotrophica]GEC24465.1 hypothetical protein PSA01_14940 [Pseudonocardia saturnea]
MRASAPLPAAPDRPARWTALRRVLDHTGHLVLYLPAGYWPRGAELLSLARRLLPEARDGRAGLARGRYRRPYLVDLRTAAPLPVDVNLSHSGDLVVVGVSRTARIGVDAERTDRTIATGPTMLARFCDPAERAWLATLDPGARVAEIARLWTCKEATAKADGRGLGLDLRTVRVGGVPDPPVHAHPVELRPGDRYWVATALLTDPPPVHGRTREEPT